MFQRAGEKAGLSIKAHTHAIRHSCGYALAKKGTDTRRLQFWLGHSDISNTVIYSQISPERRKGIWDCNTAGRHARLSQEYVQKLCPDIIKSAIEKSHKLEALREHLNRAIVAS